LSDISGAHNTLNNLGATAINASLISDTDNTDDLGSLAKAWNNTYSNKVYTTVLAPHADGTTALQITKADGTTNVLNVDTTNGRIGIGNSAPGFVLDIQGAGFTQFSMQGTSSTSAGGMRFKNDADKYAFFQIYGSAFATAAYRGDLVISNYDGGDIHFGGGNFTPALTILNPALYPYKVQVGIGLTAPTALLHLKAGTATAGTAPICLTSGTVLSSAVAGTMEFTTDDLFFTITTGAARKAFILDDGARLTSGKIPIATTNGRLVDGQTPLSGTKVYYVSDSSGGAVNKKLTFIDGILTAET
jgi:hypothetical protein